MRRTNVLLIDGPYAGRTVTCVGDRIYIRLPKIPLPGRVEVATSRARMVAPPNMITYTVFFVPVLDRHVVVGVEGNLYDIPYETIADFLLSESARKAWQ